MSCGQIALNRAGVQYKDYYASEIDKFAIQVTQQNYPKTIQMGDVRTIKTKELPDIYLLMGGSPCQGFSRAGSGLNFKDPRSKLFFEYVRILKELSPSYFLLENVQMKKEYADVITNMLGVPPIMINSSLVSAQNRPRLYWTNIPNVQQPKDLKLTIKDTLINNHDESYYIANRNIRGITARAKLAKNIRGLQDKYKCLTAGGQGGSNTGATVIKMPDGQLRLPTPEECEAAQTVPIGYTSCVSKTQRYKMLGNGWTVAVLAHIFKNLPLP